MASPAEIAMRTDLSPEPWYLFPVYPTVATVSFSARHVTPDYHTSHSRLSTAVLEHRTVEGPSEIAQLRAAQGARRENTRRI
jgi:hypothetical protein